MRSGFQLFLTEKKNGIIADLSKVVAYGESMGGYLSLQSALSQPKGTVNAVIGTYPCIDIEDEFYSKPYRKVMMGNEMIPIPLLEEILREIKPGSIV
jgi:alpha-beta hydrolase superfamily lysophospholipase